MNRPGHQLSGSPLRGLLRRSPMRRSIIARGLAALGWLAFIAGGDAMAQNAAQNPTPNPTQAWPNRPVRLVVPYGSGGPTDVLARALAQRLQESYGQTFFVDNKPGAGGILGVDLVAKAPADGYTLLFTASGTLVINPALNPRLPYKVEDLEPVSSAASYAMFLAVNPKLGLTTMAQLIAQARQNPGSLSFGSAGNGTSNHLAGELLKKMAGINLLHVPYRGNAAAMTDVIGGQISMMFDLPATTLPHVSSGKIVLLGTTDHQRSALAPQVPTIAEAGVPGFEVTSWFGVFAPAGTPRPLVAQLSQRIVELLADPAVSGKLVSQGYQVAGSSPAELAERISRDAKLWSALIREAGISQE